MCVPLTIVHIVSVKFIAKTRINGCMFFNFLLSLIIKIKVFSDKSALYEILNVFYTAVTIIKEIIPLYYCKYAKSYKILKPKA